MRFGEITKKRLRGLAAFAATAIGICTANHQSIAQQEEPAPEGWTKKIRIWGDQLPQYYTGGLFYHGQAEDPIYDYVSDQDTAEYDRLAKDLRKIRNRAQKMGKEKLRDTKNEKTQEFNAEELQRFIGALNALGDNSIRFIHSSYIYQDVLDGIEKFPKGSAVRSVMSKTVYNMASHDLKVAGHLHGTYPNIYWKAEPGNPSRERNQGIVHNHANWNFAREVSKEWTKRTLKGRTVTRGMPIEYQIQDGLNIRSYTNPIYTSEAAANLTYLTMSGLSTCEMQMTPGARRFLDERYLPTVREEIKNQRKIQQPQKGKIFFAEFILPYAVMINCDKASLTELTNSKNGGIHPTEIQALSYNSSKAAIEEGLDHYEDNIYKAQHNRGHYNNNVYNDNLGAVIDDAIPAAERLFNLKVSSTIHPGTKRYEKFHGALEETVIALNTPENPLSRYFREKGMPESTQEVIKGINAKHIPNNFHRHGGDMNVG